MEEMPQVIIKCPGCNTDNSVECGDIACAKCKARLSGHSYERSSGIIFGTVVAAALVTGGYQAHALRSPERYPLEVEYALVNTCVNGSADLLWDRERLEKKALCVCATKKVSHQLSYASAQKDGHAFSKAFEKALSQCL